MISRPRAWTATNRACAKQVRIARAATSVTFHPKNLVSIARLLVIIDLHQRLNWRDRALEGDANGRSDCCECSTLAKNAALHF
jgi:hypothetical protein